MSFQKRLIDFLFRGDCQQTRSLVLVVALALFGFFYAHAEARVDTLITKLHFDNGSTVVDPSYWDNDYQIKKFFAVLEGCEDAHILQVRLVGTSSPDGDLDQNAALAALRAQRAQQFLQKRHSKLFADSIAWSDSVIPEDWRNVEKMLPLSSVKDNDILAIMVRSVPYFILDEEGNVINTRKQVLKDYDEGLIWGQMREEIFPDCRAVEIRVIVASSATTTFAELPGTQTIAPRPNTYYPTAIEAESSSKAPSKPIIAPSKSSKKAVPQNTQATNDAKKPTNEKPVKNQVVPAENKSNNLSNNKSNKERARANDSLKNDIPTLESVPECTIPAEEYVVNRTSSFFGLFYWFLFLPTLVCLLWLIVFVLKAKFRVVYQPMIFLVLPLIAVATALLPSYVVKNAWTTANTAFLGHICFLLVLPFVYLFSRVVLKKGIIHGRHYAWLLCPLLLIFVSVGYILLAEFVFVGFTLILSTIYANKRVKMANSSKVAKDSFFHLKLMKNISWLVWVLSFYFIYLFVVNGISPYIYIAIVLLLSWFIHRFAFYADLTEGDLVSLLPVSAPVRIAQTKAADETIENTRISEPDVDEDVDVDVDVDEDVDVDKDVVEDVDEDVDDDKESVADVKIKAEPKAPVIVKSANLESLNADFDRLMNVQAYYRNPNINSDSTAKLLSTNRTYLGSMIKKRFNCSFGEYVAMKRVEYVKEYLQSNPEKTLAEVAQASGFSSVETLCRTYKKLTGSTPKANIE